MTPLLTLALLAAADPPKPAETGFGLPVQTDYHWPFYVLESPGVRKELGLTDAQVAKLDALRPELQRRMEAAFALPVNRIAAHQREVGVWLDRAVAGVLTADQRPRYRQVVWQVLEFEQGPVHLAANPAVARELGLTAEQARKARQVQADYQRDWARLVRANPGGTAARPGEEELFDKANAAALKVLTAEQKKRWNEALGKAYDGEIKPLPVPGQPPKVFKAPAGKT
ncbi:MAG: hypothetical protein K2X82_14505 [Gemmataceae bacterium]|nr:hypothetical protein [Gemmataceae bacterium]